MPLPTIAGVFRCALNWDATPGAPARVNNILHIAASSGDETDVATALDAHLTGDMFKPMSSAYILTSYDITDLGSAGASVFWTATGLVTGLSSGGIVPESAMSVGFRTATRGRSARGRAYVGPCVEGVIDSGDFAAGYADDVTAAWAAFQTDLGGNSPAMQHVVASYLLSTAYDITSYNAKPYVATQRRRLVRTRT